MGLIVTVGLTSFWPVSIGLAIYYLYWKRASIVIPKTISSYLIYAIAVIIFISSLFAFPYSGSGMYHASAIALAPIIVANWKLNLKWINALAGVQIIWMLTEYSLGVLRPSGLSDNASALGVTSLMAITPLTALATGLSLSRTALAGMTLFAILRNRRTIYALLALTFAVHVSTQLWTNPERLSFGNLNQSIELRNEAIDGSTVEIGAPLADRELRLFGYGYGGYVPSTGRIQPHNIYVLSVWELGILAVPFWIILAILLIRSRNPYMAVPVFMALTIDEWYTLTEGIFLFVVWHLFTRELSVGLTFGRLALILTGSRRRMNRLKQQAIRRSQYDHGQQA